MSDAGLRRSKTDVTPRTVYLTPVAMAQGRWKSAGMVADYTRAENAERAAKWLG